MNYKSIIYVFSLVIIAFLFQKQELPEGFVFAKTSIPDLEVELKYYGIDNFVGDTIDGYLSNTLILTKATVEQLKLIQAELQDQNLCLKIFDGYRPQRAVNHFIRWAKDLNDTINKSKFYPGVKKKNLFVEGYIASRSGHSRGSTVDLTLLDANTGIPLDMGTPFDYFGQRSWINYSGISEKQKKNRQLLQAIMLKYNFKNFSKEWWHFTLKDEPYPKTYFDFEVE